MCQLLRNLSNVGKNAGNRQIAAAERDDVVSRSERLRRRDISTNGACDDVPEDAQRSAARNEQCKKIGIKAKSLHEHVRKFAKANEESEMKLKKSLEELKNYEEL
ncbi:unnamed protein product [Caenorhabditis bovis]|uniref:Uncharacterized protein n=1 Tax=Caenorhabditis bovis TaxID=2654633 RepID=A0A8S1EPK9_9PELO|nr:unnamed protein product [Caenorhabditis bovis]